MERRIGSENRKQNVSTYIVKYLLTFTIKRTLITKLNSFLSYFRDALNPNSCVCSELHSSRAPT